MIDYKTIVENLQDNKVIELMKQLGADRYKDETKQIIFPTICHNIDASSASMKLYYYKDTHLFYCYSECGPLSIFKLLKEYYKTRNIEYNWYTDILQVIENCSTATLSASIWNNEKVYERLRDKYQRKSKKIELPIYPKGILDVFQKVYPEQWLQEGISREAMDKFNILFSTSQNKIIIPHYDVNDNLVGIRGRALKEWEIENLGKYMPVRIENIWYTHPLSLNLYGLNKNKENIKKQGYVYLFEAEKSVMQCESFKELSCAVAICGSSLNKFQLNLLMRECAPRDIILCLDREQKNNDDYFNKLYNMCKKYSHYANFSFIYDRDGLLGQKDSPSDRGEDIFNKLKGKRVIVK